MHRIKVVAQHDDVTLHVEKECVAAGAQFPCFCKSVSSPQAMESASTSTMYAKVQVFLERWPHAGWGERKALLSSTKEIKDINLEEADILSMADFAVGVAGRMAEYKTINPGFLSDLLCLLKPIEEELLPPEGAADWRIWEIFAAAKVQWRQICVLARYGYCFKGTSSDTYGLAESPLGMSTAKNLTDLVTAFKGSWKDILARISNPR